MDCLEYLKQVRNLTLKIKRMELQVLEYQRLSFSVAGPNYDREIVSQTRSREAPFEKWIIKQLDLEEEVKKQKEKLINLKFDLLDKLSKLEDSNYERILKLKYYDLLTWNEIAKEMFYTKRWLYKMHDDAIVLFQSILNNSP